MLLDDDNFDRLLYLYHGLKFMLLSNIKSRLNEKSAFEQSYILISLMGCVARHRE